MWKEHLAFSQQALFSLTGVYAHEEILGGHG